MDSLVLTDIQAGTALADEAAHLIRTAFPPEEQLSYRHLLERARQPHVRFLGFTDADGALCGLAYATQVADLVYILYLVTNPEMRSRGVGSAMLNTLKAANPGRTLLLEIETLAEPDVPNFEERLRRAAFYERNGFTPAGLREEDAGVTYDVFVCGRPLTPDDVLAAHFAMAPEIPLPRVWVVQEGDN